MKQPEQPERPGLAREVVDGVKQELADEARAWAACAKWGGLVGGLVGAVAAYFMLGGPGVGIGLLVGIPLGALLGWLGYLAVNSDLSPF
ncbi:hypothetical protein [Engelhardtia mirabilis]|uniref:hypothetical protein n=1 Tax=Engelhardtia mirabilis TaxID=2528011 RepID=UPI0011A91DB2